MTCAPALWMLQNSGVEHQHPHNDIQGYLSAELFPVAQVVADSSLACKFFLLITLAPLGKRPPL